MNGLGPIFLPFFSFKMQTRILALFTVLLLLLCTISSVDSSQFEPQGKTYICDPKCSYRYYPVESVYWSDWSRKLIVTCKLPSGNTKSCTYPALF